MSGLPVLAYRCAPTIAWVKDAGRTILVDQEEARWWAIDGVEAVIWDLFTLGYPIERLTRFLSVLLDESGEEATGRVLAAIAEWEAAGIVQAMTGDACG